jgi:hypothetical protein
MEPSGTLADVPAKTLIKQAQKDQLTGTLNIEAGEYKAHLYFFNGQLLHAIMNDKVGGDKSGEDAVFAVLDWGDGDYDIDHKSLPAKQTIFVKATELIAKHVPSATPYLPPRANQQPSGYPSSPPGYPPYPQAPPGYPPTPYPPPAYYPPPSAPVPSAPPGGDYSGVPEFAASTSPTETIPETDATESEKIAKNSELEQPQDEDYFSIPEMYRTLSPSEDVSSEGMRLFDPPFPEGVHPAASSAVLDFPKILRKLHQDGSSGYISLRGTNFKSVLLLSDGTIIASFYEVRGALLNGEKAFNKILSHIEAGQGDINVENLDHQQLEAFIKLITTPVLGQTFPAKWFNLKEMVSSFLEMESSVAIVVESEDDKESDYGIIMLAKGSLIGAYTRNTPKLTSDLTLIEDLQTSLTNGALTIRSDSI